MEILLTYLTLDYILPAGVGVLITWIIQKLKGTKWLGFLTNPKVLVVVVGLLGTGIALVANPLLVMAGLAQPTAIAVLMERAFAITGTAAALTYTNLVKKKKTG